MQAPVYEKSTHKKANPRRNRGAALVAALICAVLTTAGCVTAEPKGKIQVTPGELAILEGNNQILSFELPASDSGEAGSSDGSGLAGGGSAGDAKPEWSSDDTAVAAITPRGMLIAIKEGTTKIRVKVGEETGFMTVTVVKPTIRLENIWIARTLYEKDGKALYGQPADDDLSAQWSIEAAEGDTKYVRNKASGRYLSIDNNQDWVETVAKPGPGALWLITAGSIAGGTTFQSARDSGTYLHVEGKKGYAQADDTVQASWTSPQWKVVKVALPDPNASGSSLDTLVKNGDFGLLKSNAEGIKTADGKTAAGSAFWSFGDNMDNTGGKAAAAVEGGVLKVSLADGGKFSYSVQLLQSPVNVEKGKSYLVYFDARASEERPIEVKVGGLADRDWLNYTGGGETGTVMNIGKDFAHYSFVFSMKEASDPRARLEFQLGGAKASKNSTVWLDNIRLEEIALSNQLKNGSFDKDDEAAPKIQFVQNSSWWTFGADMGGAGGSATIANEDGMARVDIKDPGRDVYAIQLIQNPVRVVKGVTYRASFDAKASDARSIDLKVGGVADRNWTDYTKGTGNGRIVSITKDLKNYSFEFAMTDDTDHSARLEFQLGGTNPGTVWIDNVSLTPVSIDAKASATSSSGITGASTGSPETGVWSPGTTAIVIPEIKNRGAALPFRSYEAEEAATNGSMIGPDRNLNKLATEAIGRRAVKLVNKGDYVEFTLKDAANGFVLRYAIPDSADGQGQDAPLAFYVDGVKKQDLVLSSKYAWVYGAFPWTNVPSDGAPRKFFDEINFMTAKTNAGAKIRLQKDAANNLDYYIDLLDAELVPDPVAMPTSGFISVIDFGAKADDGKDDADAFEKGIAEAAKQGKGLWIPKGVFNIAKGRELYADAAIRGAGMWYSVLKVGKQAFYGTGETFTLKDLAIFGSATQRDDNNDENGFKGNAGKGSLIENVWFDKLKVGIWSEKGTDGLTIRGSRFRNLLADGINLAQGSKNSTIEHSHFRGTGDDAIASWSATYNNYNLPAANNIIRFNTIQSPWLANGIAIYGGTGHVIEDNVVSDIVMNGAGINISSNFDPVPFSGSITVQRNTLIRAGSPNSGSPRAAKGALWIFAANQDIDIKLTVKDIDIYDASFSGISIEGRKVLKNAAIENILIDGAATWGIHLLGTAQGTANFTKVTVRNARSGGLSNEGGFVANKSGAVGW